MKAQAFCVLVTPTGDNDQSEKKGLIIVHNEQPQAKIYRGVVEHVGARIVEDIEPGNVVHYNAFTPIAVDTDSEVHVVPQQHILCYEDDE